MYRQKQSSENKKTTTQINRLDYLEIDVKGWRARSLTEDIINFINDYFDKETKTNTKKQLRNNYAEAKTAIDNSFNKFINKQDTDTDFLQSAHRQAVKELKD